MLNRPTDDDDMTTIQVVELGVLGPLQARRDGAAVTIPGAKPRSNIGAVVTHVAHGISQAGFDAEWRDIQLLTVDGNVLNRCELFDEADLDTALARHFRLRSLRLAHRRHVEVGNPQ